jgi:hypothetical protein
MIQASETRYAKSGRTEDSSVTEREFSEAVDRVYEKYGSNLSAFYRDVKKSVVVEKCEPVKPKR